LGTLLSAQRFDLNLHPLDALKQLFEDVLADLKVPSQDIASIGRLLCFR